LWRGIRKNKTFVLNQISISSSSDLTTIPSQKTYIMERNIRTFDLSSPIQAFQFATFLLRVRKQSEELEILFGEKKTEFVKKASGNELTEWTKEAQSDSQKMPSAAQPDKTSTTEVPVVGVDESE
jgi:hypothetical protein